MPAADPSRAQLRAECIAKRLNLDQATRLLASQTISLGLSALLAAQAPQAHVIAAFMPHRGEVDLQPWLASLAAAGQTQLALPVVSTINGPLQFAKYQPGDPLTRDQFGILIPVRHHWLAPEVLLIPCVGFSSAGLRLGYGGGYYDRTLAALPPHQKPLSIGIAFACQICQIKAQAHDIPMDYILTETKLHRPAT